MTIDMTTFVVIKEIYDYHDYSAHKLVAKIIRHIFYHNSKFAIVIGSSTIIIIMTFFYNYIYIYWLKVEKKGIK
jgi:translation initiation factor RLI1